MDKITYIIKLGQLYLHTIEKDATKVILTDEATLAKECIVKIEATSIASMLSLRTGATPTVCMRTYSCAEEPIVMEATPLK